MARNSAGIGAILACALLAAHALAQRSTPPSLPPIAPAAPGKCALALTALPDKAYGIFAPVEAVTWTVGASSIVPPVEGWALWAKSLQGAWAGFVPGPPSHIGVHVTNGDLWALSTSSYEVRPGEKWTFTAVIAGRDIAAARDAFAGMSIVASGADDQVVNWQLGKAFDAGTFGWKLRSITVEVPTGVVKLEPRFEGFGGGHYFVSSAAFERSTSPAPLPVPQLPVPTPSEGPSVTAAYWIVDAHGMPCASGTVPLGQQVRLASPAPGFYELRLREASAEPGGAPAGLCSAVVVSQPPPLPPGSTPFGTQASPSELLPRLGLTWDRPLYYDIISGAHNKLPADPRAFADAWEKKAREGLPPYQAGCVEVWNEPEGELGELGKAWKMADFVATVKATRDGIRRVRTDVKVAPDFVNYLWGASSTYREFLRAGGGPVHDAITVHPYSTALYNDPKAPESPEEDMVAEYIASICELMRREGVGDREIWTTEYGWPTGAGGPWSTSELNQARFIVRSSVLQIAAGARRVCPFRMTSVLSWGPMDGTFGFLRFDGTPKPVVAAYSILAQTLNRLPYAGRLDFGRNVGAFVFGDNAGSAMVIWRPDAETRLWLKLPAGKVGVLDMLGKPLPVTGRSAALVAGPSPVYVCAPAPPLALAAAVGKRLVTGAPVGVFEVGKRSTLRWTIPLLAKTPTIDGILSEWSCPPISLQDAPTRCRAQVRVGLGKRDLFVAAAVRGPIVIGANTYPPDRAWDGDGVDLYISARPAGRLFREMRPGIDHRILLVPGNRGRGACAVDLSSGEPAHAIPDARVAVRVVPGGYDIGASLPLEVIAAPGEIRPGSRLAFDLAVDVGQDGHQRTRLATHRGRAWLTSYVWGEATVTKE